MACCNLADSFENSASVTVGYSDAVTGARQIRILGLSGVYTQMLDENRPENQESHCRTVARTEEHRLRNMDGLYLHDPGNRHRRRPLQHLAQYL